MRSDQTDGPALHQQANHSFRGNSPVCGISAGKQFVDEEKDRGALRCTVESCFQPFNFSVKMRAVAHQRIIDADGSAHAKR